MQQNCLDKTKFGREGDVTMHAHEFFQNPPPVKGAQCFVAMPFNADHSNLLYSALESALDQVGMVCRRADEDIRGSSVLLDVLWGLAEAELIIADLTGCNENVFYELGLAHAARSDKSVVLLAQDINTIPFDVSGLHVVHYEASIDGFSALQIDLIKMIRDSILPSKFLYRWSESKDGKTSEAYGGVDQKYLYSFRVCDVIPGRDAAQFRLVVRRHISATTIEEIYNEIQPVLVKNATVPIPHLPSWFIRMDEASGSEVRLCACRA